MTTIKIGDRVSWWEPFKNQPKFEARTMTGTVASVHGGRGNPWVVINGDGTGFLGSRWVRDVAKLTKLDDTPTDTEIVAAFQARELAEEVRERAITSLRLFVDDYDFAVGQAGDLGGAEVWSQEAMNL